MQILSTTIDLLNILIMAKYLEYIILVVVSFFVAWLVSKFLRKTLDFFINKNSQQLQTDPTNFIFLKNSISFVCYSIALFWVFSKIPYFKNLGTALFASAGVLAAVVGFASQKAFSNIVGGIFILIFKPFRVGDNIEIANGRNGIVEEITLRHTVIKDYEFRRIVIPNSHMSDDTIINSSITDKKIRKHIDIGVSYDTDLTKAESIIRETIESHPLFIDNRTKKDKQNESPAVPVKLTNLGEYSINLRAFVWTSGFDAANELHWDVLRCIKDKFDEEGVEIPYPYRTLLIKKYDGTNDSN